LALICALFTLAGCVSAPPITHFQVVGTHNSYKRSIDGALVAAASGGGRDLGSVDYAHLPLRDQLNLGIRSLELDVFNDPDGGAYASPLGMAMLRMAGITPLDHGGGGDIHAPGFKVIHDCDFDYRTWNLDLRDALVELRSWSTANPDHHPIVITVNTKEGDPWMEGGTVAIGFDVEAMDNLDTIIREALGDHLLVPDDVRLGRETLREGVLAGGWPSLDHARGKYVWVLDQGGSPKSAYLEARPGTKGGVFFTTGNDSEDTAAFFIINNPIRDHDKIRSLVRRGFMVRTRADAGLREARERDYARFEAAKSSGAQVISTDFPIPDRLIDREYMIRFDDMGFVRPNPVIDSD
ncbi:MAG: Ca2+-dependent phosphoinositide-specific phospholipase C, partial [Planctomycetota bacterium]